MIKGFEVGHWYRYIGTYDYFPDGIQDFVLDRKPYKCVLSNGRETAHFANEPNQDGLELCISQGCTGWEWGSLENWEEYFPQVECPHCHKVVEQDILGLCPECTWNLKED